MAAEAYELVARRDFKDNEKPSARTVWQVKGATSYANARAALDAALPTTFTFPSTAVAYLSDIDATELLEDSFFEFSIGYQSQVREPAANTEEFEFDIPALDERVYRAISTSSYAPAGETAPDFGGAIGVRYGTMQPQGVTPLKAKSTFSITKHWTLSAVDTAFQAALEDLVGSINSSIFNGRAIGTVRFLGARGRQNGNKFPIQYLFGYRPSAASYTLNGISVAASYGWDVHDTYYRPEPDTTAKQPVWKPAAVYVHRIHTPANLGSLL